MRYLIFCLLCGLGCSLYVVYRISDNRKEDHSKKFPFLKHWSKCAIFKHFAKTFHGHSIHVFADNIENSTYLCILNVIGANNITRTFETNSKSFLSAVHYSIKNFSPFDAVYLAEDDYLYTQNAPYIIEEGLSLADYATGYDHPGSYDLDITTTVLRSKSHHWKYTASTCMTFAAHVRTLIADIKVYTTFLSRIVPEDFKMFTTLRRLHNRTIVSSIPGVSTHGNTLSMSPFVDWAAEYNRTLKAYAGNPNS